MRLTCTSAQRQSTSYIDGRLRAQQRARVAAHLRECDACAGYFEQMADNRSLLRSTPAPKIPRRVTAALQVLASQERDLIRNSGGSPLRAMLERWRFRLEGLMRPFALPATGGLVSTVVLFPTLVLAIGTSARVVSYEVPLAYNPPRVEATLVPVELRTQDITVTMSLDQNGKITDYAVADGKASFAGDSSKLLTPNISLPSVLGVAQPISGDIQISFRPLGFRQ
jgi:anti-sigma factor RsiW